MDNDVVTVMWGEFGRTPKINNNDGGRDHWSPVMGAMVAGGGLKMGQAVGASTRPRRVPEGPPLHRAAGAQHDLPAPWASTRRMTFPNGSGRPMYILDDRNRSAN